MFTKSFESSAFGTCADVDQSRVRMIRVSRLLGRAVRARASCVPSRDRRPPPADDFNMLVLKNLYQFDYFKLIAVK